jgi:hypothetical protein
VIPGETISGLIEGDGCLTFHIRLYKKSLLIEASLRFTVEKGASLLIEVFCSYFQDDFTHKSKLKSFTPVGSAVHVYWSSNKEILQRLAMHVQKYPILGPQGRRLKFLILF